MAWHRGQQTMDILIFLLKLPCTNDYTITSPLPLKTFFLKLQEPCEVLLPIYVRFPAADTCPAHYSCILIDKSKKQSSLGYTYLKVAVWFCWWKGNWNGKEVSRMPSDTKFHATTLVWWINHWQLPLENWMLVIIVVFTIDLAYNWSTNTMPGNGKKGNINVLFAWLRKTLWKFNIP